MLKKLETIWCGKHRKDQAVENEEKKNKTNKKRKDGIKEGREELINSAWFLSFLTIGVKIQHEPIGKLLTNNILDTFFIKVILQV